MRRWWFKLFALILGLILTVQAWGQSDDKKAFYVYRNDGQFNAFFHSEIDSIVCSPIGLDSTRYAYDVVQEFWTEDSVYRIPIASIDSVSFVTPEVILSEKVVRMEGGLLDYLLRAEGMELFFSGDLPHAMRPNVGDILVCTDFENSYFEEGFVGKVYDGFEQSGEYVVECDTVMDITEIFEQLIAVEEMTVDNPASASPQTKGVWNSAVIPVGMNLAYDIGDGDLDFSMNGQLDGQLRATVVYNITKENQFIGLTLRHDWNLSAGLKISASKSFFRTTASRQLTPAIRFPAFMPLLKFQLMGALFAKGELKANVEATMSGAPNRYVSSLSYYNGTFKGSHSDLGTSGGFTPQFSSKISLDGKVQFGGLLDVYLGTIECLGYMKSAIDFYVGPQLSGNFSWDVSSAASLDYYNTIKDSKIGVSLLTVGVEAYGEASYWGRPVKRHQFFSAELPSLLYNEWYLFPNFSDIEVDPNATGRTARLICRPSRNVLLPQTLGFGLYDQDGKIQEDWLSNVPYKQDDSGLVLGHTFESLLRNKLYLACPVIKFNDILIPATPQKEFTLECGVVTGGVSGITDKAAVCAGEIDLPDEYSQLSYGICYSFSTSLPRIENSFVVEGVSSGDYFSVNLSGLRENTTYYYCAYLSLDGHRYYGDVRSFTTEKKKDEITPGQMVDLGLSVKWAGWNVGASSPEEYGGYYAWGELHEKSYYNEDTYQYYEQKNYQYIFIGNDISGTQYDVARFQWGGSWRMPTLAECQELINECDWTWTTYNGVNGLKVTGPNGNSIFLPAAGFRYGTSVVDQGSFGPFWSGTLNEGLCYKAYCLYFHGDYAYWTYGNRYLGHSVRPVSE